jgi:hypothetical protein
LDFDGHVTEDTCFNDGQSFFSPAYSEDCSVSDFSAEIATIADAFDRVAEDFAFFNINFTTMGSGYTSNVTQWDNGEYFDANNAGLGTNRGKGWVDLAVITSYNGFGYRPDCCGQSPMTRVILSWSN